jgi:cytidine deaminase
MLGRNNGIIKNIDINQLFTKALTISKKAYARYSNFQVGACIVSHTGEVFFGVNVENASHPCGQCAEASAIGNMVTQLGPEAKIEIVVVVANAPGGVLPCGNCLQRISEFSEGHTQILSANLEGVQRQFSLDDLMPHRFQSER